MADSLGSGAKHPSDVIGHWGPVQRSIFITVVISYFVAFFSNATLPFYAPKLKFTCHYLDGEKLVSLENACTFNDTSGVETKCSNFTYDHSFFKRTIVEEFDLVCDREWMASFSQSLHQVGYAISSIGLGFVSDRRGRVITVKCAMVLEILAGFMMVLSPNVYVFLASRVFTGIAAYGRFLTGYVLIAEWVGPKVRTKALYTYEVGYTIGFTLTVMSYYLVADYKIIQATVYTIEILIFILYCCIVLETPRWLITHGKVEEAEATMTKVAKARGLFSPAEIKSRIDSIISNSMLEFELEKNAKDQTIFDMWKEPLFLKLSLILYYTWFVNAFLMYGTFLNTQNLGGSLFTNMTVFVICDYLFFLASVGIINRLPRKKSLIYAMVVEAIALVLLVLTSLKEELLIYRIILSVVLRIGNGMVGQIYHMYTAETFPTAMRQVGLGSCGLAARFGSTMAPFVKELTVIAGLYVVFAIYAVLVIINIIIIQFIPDTGKIEVADTIGQKKKEVAQTMIRSMSIVSPL